MGVLVFVGTIAVRTSVEPPLVLNNPQNFAELLKILSGVAKEKMIFGNRLNILAATNLSKSLLEIILLAVGG